MELLLKCYFALCDAYIEKRDRQTSSPFFPRLPKYLDYERSVVVIVLYVG